MGFRWAIYFLLFIVTLWVNIRIYQLVRKKPVSARNVGAYRTILLITAIYACFMSLRTIWIWLDPLNIYVIEIFEDPPLDMILAAIANGIVAGFVIVTGFIAEKKIRDGNE